MSIFPHKHLYTNNDLQFAVFLTVQIAIAVQVCCIRNIGLGSNRYRGHSVRGRRRARSAAWMHHLRTPSMSENEDESSPQPTQNDFNLSPFEGEAIPISSNSSTASDNGDT